MVQTTEGKCIQQMKKNEQTVLHHHDHNMDLPNGELKNKVMAALQKNIGNDVHEYECHTLSLKQMLLFKKHPWIMEQIQQILKKPHEITRNEEIICRYCSLDMVISCGQCPAVACNMTVAEYCQRYVVLHQILETIYMYSNGSTYPAVASLIADLEVGFTA